MKFKLQKIYKFFILIKNYLFYYKKIEKKFNKKYIIN